MSPYASIAAPTPATTRYPTAPFDEAGPAAMPGTRASLWGTILGTLTTGVGIGASLVPLAPPHAFVRSVAAGVVTGVASAVLIRAFGDGTGVSFFACLEPSDLAGLAEPEYSRLDALAVAGDLPGALAGYEAIVRADPGEAVARLQAAELYVLAGNPRRAEALLLEVQRHPARTDSHDLRASNRLVDLYLGPLAEPVKALHELRRMADARAGTAAGDGAREAVRRITGGD